MAFKAAVSVKVGHSEEAPPQNPWEAPSADEVSGIFYSEGGTPGEALFNVIEKVNIFAQGLSVAGATGQPS